MAGDALPDRDAPVDLNVARLIARKCFDSLRVDDTLDAWWEDHYADCFEEWWTHGILCGCNLDILRYELEDAKGANQKGTLYIEAMKLAFSGFILARENPWWSLNEHHPDIDAVVRKGLDLMIEARGWSGPPEITHDTAWAHRQANERQQMWLKTVMANAERPVDVDAA